MTGSAVRSELYAIDVASRRARLIRTWPGSIPGPPEVSATVAYSPDGSKIGVSLIRESPADDTPSAERLLMLDAATGRTLWQARYPLRPGQSAPFVRFMPRGALLTSAPQGDTIVWSASSGRILRRFPIGGVAGLSADGREVALGVDNPSLANPFSHVAVLNLRTGEQRNLRADLPSEEIRTIAFTPDGSKIVANTTDSVHVWDAASGTITETYSASLGRRQLMTLDPRGASVIVGGQDGSVAVFDLSGTRRLGRSFSWNRPSQSCDNSPCAIVNQQGTMATDQGDGSIALVDLHTLRLTRTLPAREGALANGIAFAPGGRTLVAGGTNGDVVFWDLRTARVLQTLRFHDPVWWTAISPDGKLLAVQTQSNDSPDNRVQLVRIATGKVLQSHLVRYGYGGVKFTQDGRELVSLGCCAATSMLVAWETRTGAQLFRRTAGVQATSFDLTPDSRHIGVGTTNGKLLFLDARSARQIGAPIQVAAGLVISVAFSPDGRSFAVGSTDATSSLWDVASRKRLGDPFPPYPGAVPVVAFEPDGRLLIIPLANAYDWPTDARAWERFACRLAGRDLTPQEWHDLLPGRAYRPVCSPVPRRSSGP